jgi:hypothetical protein
MGSIRSRRDASGVVGANAGGFLTEAAMTTRAGALRLWPFPAPSPASPSLWSTPISWPTPGRRWRCCSASAWCSAGSGCGPSPSPPAHFIHATYNGTIFTILFFATGGFRHLDKIT